MISDGHISLFRPVPVPGQWWARRNPTALFRIASYDRDAEIVSAHYWDSYSEGEKAHFMRFDASEFEYLWFSEILDPMPGREYRTGQVYRYKDHVFFIGPQEHGGKVRVYASWVVLENDFYFAELYQDGPPVQKPGLVAHLLDNALD